MSTETAVKTDIASEQISADDNKTTELVPVKDSLPSAEYEQKLEVAMQELANLDTNAIIHFGSQAQEQLTTVSDQMLTGVKTKDAGPAGDMLNEMVVVLRGFDVGKLDPSKKQSLWDKLMFKAKPIVKFKERYEEVNDQIETIAHALEKHKETLLIDIKSLDKLYEANLSYFHHLELYIDAGVKKIEELDSVTIPEMIKKAEASNEMLDAQALKDLRAMRDDLERRVHDLRLTRQVAMQALPSIRMVQENDKGLVNKINSTMVNTIPLWQQQLAQAIAIFRSSEAAGTLKAATDLTNDLLESNAANLKDANKVAREQIERGIFDIASVEKANQTLIATIEESLQITAAGKKARSEALVKLEECENELKETLRQAAIKEKQITGTDT